MIELLTTAMVTGLVFCLGINDTKNDKPFLWGMLSGVVLVALVLWLEHNAGGH